MSGQPSRRPGQHLAQPAGRTSARTSDRTSDRAVRPPGWPAQVRPPGVPDWESTAVAWLLDLCPPEYRTYPTLRRHAVVLARFAVLHVEACQAAVNRGLSEARGDLREVADGSVVDAARTRHGAGAARVHERRSGKR